MFTLPPTQTRDRYGCYATTELLRGNPTLDAQRVGKVEVFGFDRLATKVTEPYLFTNYIR